MVLTDRGMPGSSHARSPCGELGVGHSRCSLDDSHGIFLGKWLGVHQRVTMGWVVCHKWSPIKILEKGGPASSSDQEIIFEEFARWDWDLSGFNK